MYCIICRVLNTFNFKIMQYIYYICIALSVDNFTDNAIHLPYIVNVLHNFKIIGLKIALYVESLS